MAGYRHYLRLFEWEKWKTAKVYLRWNVLTNLNAELEEKNINLHNTHDVKKVVQIADEYC